MIRFLRKRKNDSVFGESLRERTFLSYQNIRKILVVFDIADTGDVCDVIDLLEKDGKTVLAWTARSKGKTQTIFCPPHIRVIDGSKDLTWSQTLTKDAIDEFQKLDYDTFLDLTTSDNDILDYLLATNSSRFCIGVREREVKAYDLIMLKKEDTSLSDTCLQLKYYLENIIA